MILAMDTSTDWCSVALYDPAGGVRAEQTWYAHRDQTAQLLPVVQHLLGQIKKTVDDVSSLAVALGPGSFTGLRVGLAAGLGALPHAARSLAAPQRISEHHHRRAVRADRATDAIRRRAGGACG